MKWVKATLAFAVLLGTIASGTTLAQSTTGTLRGNVTDESGGVLPGATVEAKNDDTGFLRNATTAGDGFFNISVQPGPYTVTATLPSFRTETRKVRVLLGETQSLDFRMILEARASQAVTVTAEAPVLEARSNEIATNVTEVQIKNLPQGSRNFLNFAALAPGVRVSDSIDNKQVNAAGAEGFNTNVFIDGTSYKNDVLLGGVVGQDSSKGNPFPQNAVQEFRVMTQNFKAEYEKAGTAVITAVTKSGTNTYSGDVFAYYQNKNLVARSPFLGPRQTCNSAGVCTGTPDPDYTRWQAGVDFGGPIINDKVHFYASYELNDQNRANTVILGGQALPPAIKARLSTFTGTFTSPFRENLAFGKLSWQAGASDLLDVSGFYRHETDVKDYGAQTSFQSANNILQNIWNVQGKYTLSGSRFLSETTLSYNNYQWHPTPTNAGIASALSPSQITEADWQETIRVNLTSVFLVTQRALPTMRAKRWGRIINLSSVAAQYGGIVGPHYSASKAGILGLTRSYAYFLAKEGITVNAIAPALIETDMIASLPALTPDRLPVGSFGSVEEVARITILLAQSSFITGQTINPNGGVYFT